MKKLIFAVLSASAMLVMAEEAKSAEGASTEAVKEAVAVGAKAERPRPPRIDRAKFLEMQAEFKAARVAKVVEALKTAGIDEAKAKELSEQIEQIYTARPNRPNRPQRPPRRAVKAAQPEAGAPAEAPQAK